MPKSYVKICLAISSPNFWAITRIVRRLSEQIGFWKFSESLSALYVLGGPLLSILTLFEKFMPLEDTRYFHSFCAICFREHYTCFTCTIS
jgi:hypothetical protein